MNIFYVLLRRELLCLFEWWQWSTFLSSLVLLATTMPQHNILYNYIYININVYIIYLVRCPHRWYCIIDIIVNSKIPSLLESVRKQTIYDYFWWETTLNLLYNLSVFHCCIIYGQAVQLVVFLNGNITIVWN